MPIIKFKNVYPGIAVACLDFYFTLISNILINFAQILV